MAELLGNHSNYNNNNNIPIGTGSYQQQQQQQQLPPLQQPQQLQQPHHHQQPQQPQQPQQQPIPAPEVDASEEIWVETKSGDGKSYYYHAKSRETTWNKPEGANVKVLTQQQVRIDLQSYVNTLVT